MHASYGLYGLGLLFAAFLLIAVGQHLLNRPGAPRDPDAFGLAEATAFLFTLLLAIGLATVAEALTDRAEATTYVGLGLGAAALAAVATAVLVLLRRLRRTETARSAPVPDARRDGRPEGPRGPGRAGGRKGQRRAA